MNQKPNAITQQLALFSVKYDIFLAELFQSLVSAREKGKTNCHDLIITYRGTIEKAVFMITKGAVIVYQFKIDETLLQRTDLKFEKWMNTSKVRKQIRRNTTQLTKQVQDLRYGMKNITLEAQVIQTVPSKVHTQYGKTVLLTNVLIGDATGQVRLCLWNEQGTWVSEGDRIQIKNANVSMYKGERQVRIKKSSIITVLPSLVPVRTTV
jgi:replication factor A1